jgi:hypothetical protein
MNLKEIGWEHVEWIHLAEVRDQLQAVVNKIMNLWGECMYVCMYVCMHACVLGNNGTSRKLLLRYPLECIEFDPRQGY